MVDWLNHWKIYIIIFAAAVIVLFSVFILIFKLKNKRKIYISNQNYIPPMPISNIIIDKKRFTHEWLSNPMPQNVRVYLELTNIITGKNCKLRFKKQLSAGRSRMCKFVIRDPLVSKTHCIFSFEGNRLLIWDNNSDNGTILNGILIKDKIPIYSGDLLLIGEKEFKVEAWGIE